MSAPEPQQFEAKSSIKIGSTAAGVPTVEVKTYVGTDEDEMNETRILAVAAYKATRADVGFPVTSA